MANETVVEAAVQKNVEPRRGIMAPDQILACDTGKQYIVEKMLGAGRYGEVYKVALTKEPEKKFALKIAENNPKSNRLKTEALIFEEIDKASTSVDKTHFVKMYHHGRTPTFKYYLMDLIWMCLDEVAASLLTPSTLIQIARQTLQGIEALHNLGYMHRDIAPWYFAIGMPPKDNVIYLLDFGTVRSHKNPRQPRSRDNFGACPRYASIAAMEEQDPVRKDDIVSWMYMMLELYDRKNLPWWDLKDKKAILKAKQEQQKNWLALTKSRTINAPINFYWINTWIMKEQKPPNPVDFAYLYKELTTTATLDNINEKIPLSWVGKRPKSPEKADKVVTHTTATTTMDEKKKKKRKCTHATQADVQVAMDDLLQMIEKQKKLLKKQQEEELEDDDEEDDDSDGSSTARRRKKKKGGKSKSPGKSSGKTKGSRNSGGKRRRRRSGRKRSRDKESRDRLRSSNNTATGQETLADETEEKTKNDCEMSIEPYKFRKKPARKEGTGKTDDRKGDSEQKKNQPESSDVRSEGKTVEVEIKTKESFENKDDKKSRAEEDLELVSVKGMEMDKEWDEDGKKDEKPAKPLPPEPAKKADEAAPTKKEKAACKK